MTIIKNFILVNNVLSICHQVLHDLICFVITYLKRVIIYQDSLSLDQQLNWFIKIV